MKAQLGRGLGIFRTDLDVIQQQSALAGALRERCARRERRASAQGAAKFLEQVIVPDKAETMPPIISLAAGSGRLEAVYCVESKKETTFANKKTLVVDGLPLASKLWSDRDRWEIPPDDLRLVLPKAFTS